MFDTVSLEIYGMLLLSLMKVDLFSFRVLYTFWPMKRYEYLLRTYFYFFSLDVYQHFHNRNSYRALRLFFSLSSLKIILQIRKNMYIFPAFW